jgi:hypothetical protein
MTDLFPINTSAAKSALAHLEQALKTIQTEQCGSGNSDINPILIEHRHRQAILAVEDAYKAVAAYQRSLEL